MKQIKTQRDEVKIYCPLYAIWARAVDNSPLSGQCGYLTENGKVLLYSEKEAAEQRRHDILNLCVNKKPAAEYQIIGWLDYDTPLQCLPLETIKGYDLIPDFEPSEYEIRYQCYGNTGGGCMVGTVAFYLPSLDKTVWVNCNEEGVTITSADHIWNEDHSGSWARSEDVLLFNVDFRTNKPENVGMWLPLIREALAYTIARQTGEYGRSFRLPVEWLPDTYRESTAKDYLIWAQGNCTAVTISPGGQIDPGEYCQNDRRRFESKKMLVYVASPYAGDTKHNIEFAKQACRSVMENGHAFFAPHLLYPSILDDTAPEQREMGMEMGILVLSKCDELWVFGDTISKGMQAEIDAADRMGIPVQYMTLSMNQGSPTPGMQVPC